MRIDGLITAHDAEAAIAPYRIVKHGAADGAVVQAAASTDALIGVTNQLGGASGGRAEVHRSGIAEVEYGGAVTRGAWLTSDANGKAVAAAPGAGTNAQVIGRAERSGADGDIGSVCLAPGSIQG